MSNDDAGRRGFDDLVEVTRDLVHQHFPPCCGYEAYSTHLSGPVEGALWRITRGPFAVELGVQRFARAGEDRREHPTMEVRLVASAGPGEPGALPCESRERRVVGWAVAGWGLGAAVLGGLMLGGAGLVPGWGQALLLIPAIAGWRAAVVGLVRRAEPPPALSQAASPKALVSARVVGGLERWAQMVPALRAQRDLLQSRGAAPPFRSQGHLESTSPTPHARMRQVLAACSSSFTWARPALLAATEASDHAGLPPGRTRHTRPPRPGSGT